jgi:hypothetical protein
MGGKSTMDYRWKDYQSGFSFALWVCGAVFMCTALIMPVMPEEVYGEAVTSISAEIWSLGVMIASTISLIGIYKNGRSRWSPLLRVCGYFLHFIIFSLFAVLSASTVFGLYLTIYSSVFFAPHMAFFIWVNRADVLNVFRGC